MKSTSKYMLNLYRQYCKSSGKDCSGINILTDEEFIKWIIALVRKTKVYAEYLEYLNVTLDNESTIEIGKGKYDTLGKYLVTIISPFAETVGLQNSEIVIEKEEPLVLVGSSIYSINECQIFLTQNPYDSTALDNIKSLYDAGFNICLGVYGSTQDMDKNDKLKMLKTMQNQLADDNEIYYDTYDSNYFGCLKRKPKILTLSRSR